MVSVIHYQYNYIDSNNVDSLATYSLRYISNCGNCINDNGVYQTRMFWSWSPVLTLPIYKMQGKKYFKPGRP